MDSLEWDIYKERAKVKSPGFAAVLGFFIPWAEAFYNGKIIPGLFLLGVDFFFIILSFLGIGIPMILLYGFWGAWQNHKWATATNLTTLERMVAERKKTVAPEGPGAPV